MFFAESLIGSPIDLLALPLWGYLEDTLRITLRVHLSERKPDYFEDTFVGKENLSASRRKARSHEDTWNANFRTIEGFHRGFESMLQMWNQDIWKFIEAIQRQQSLQFFTLSQLQLKKKVHASKKKLSWDFRKNSLWVLVRKTITMVSLLRFFRFLSLRS